MRDSEQWDRFVRRAGSVPRCGVRRFARSAGFHARNSTCRGREGSLRDVSYKSARASGDARRRARLRNADGPPQAVGAAPELSSWVACGGGLLPTRRHRRERGTNNELHVHAVVDLVVRAAMVRLVVLRFFPGRYSGDVVAPVGVAGGRVVVARPLRRFIC